MPTSSGQAITAEQKTTDTFIKDAVQAPDGLVIDPPLIREVAGVLFEAAENVAFRRAQNNGTAVIAYIVCDDGRNPDGSPIAAPVPTSANYHGLIAPSTADNDGFGGVEIFRFTKSKIVFAAIGAGSIKVATMQYRNPGVRVV